MFKTKIAPNFVFLDKNKKNSFLQTNLGGGIALPLACCHDANGFVPEVL